MNTIPDRASRQVFTVHFRTDTAWATEDIEADTPEHALKQARTRMNEDKGSLWFEPYDGGTEVNEIVVSDIDGNEVSLWRDDDLRIRLAVNDLLDALKQAVVALNTAPRFRVPGLDTDSYAIAALCDQAIAKACGR